MSYQGSNLGRQTRNDDDESDVQKINKRRKQDSDATTATTTTNENTIQEKPQEHNTKVDDQNSRFSLTPKNLVMTSSESAQVNNTEKEMDPIQITSMDIDGNGPPPETELETSMTIDEMVNLARNTWEAKEENELETVQGARTYSQVIRGEEPQQKKRREPTDMTWADLVVERIETSLESEFDIEEWHYEKILEAFTNEEEMCEF